MFAKLLKKDRGSQGMTAAIILIAFIITASGIAFVILTMGGNLINKLQGTGARAVEATGSYVQVQGDVIGTGNGTHIDEIEFYLALTLSTGSVDFANDSILVLVTVGSNERTKLDYNTVTGTAGEYVITFENDDGDDLLEPGEIIKFVAALPTGHEAGTNEIIRIEIISQAAVIQIIRSTPSGIDDGTNVLI